MWGRGLGRGLRALGVGVTRMLQGILGVGQAAFE
jgi:hypothetical protein